MNVCDHLITVSLSYLAINSVRGGNVSAVALHIAPVYPMLNTLAVGFCRELLGTDRSVGSLCVWAAPEGWKARLFLLRARASLLLTNPLQTSENPVRWK